MGQLGSKLRSITNGYMFWCPGCQEPHIVNKSWSFDGNIESPTFSPSILVRNGHYAEGHTGDECWCTYNVKHPNNLSGFKCKQCHSFVKAGNIEFLSDCSHQLAGKTVILPNLPEYLQDRTKI